MQLHHKTALVTGASKGIGKAIARALGEAGASVVVSSRDQAAVDAVAAEFSAAGIRAAAAACNVGRLDELPGLISRTLEHFGRLDILVNNAGINPVFGPALEIDWRAYDKIMDVNVKGPFELARLAHPHLKAQGGGSVINISSVEGFTPSPGLGIYSVSKASLIMLTKVLAREWGPDGIRVNAICPGFVRTKLSQALFENKAVHQMIMGKQALRHEGSPEDIAGLALLLASDAGQFITGAALTADGGLTI
ncbi:MAG: SDR family oxidoreductase [Bacteroidia bacterium]|nr:SDR family oxidoreductase [Bacteroidia bacterium]